MANVNSAVANESAALSAVYSAYDEESAAQTAYDTAKGQIYSGWQSDYNDFRAEAATNATTLASAQAKQTVAEKDVNDATAAVASQSAAVKAQRAAEKKLGEYQNALAEATETLKKAEKATEAAQKAVDYDNGKSALTGVRKNGKTDQDVMNAKSATDALPALKAKLDAAKANHQAAIAKHDNVADPAVKAAKSAYQQAKWDNGLATKDQLDSFWNKKVAPAASAAVAEIAKVDAASAAVTNLESGFKNDAKAVASAQAALDSAEATVATAQKAVDAANATLAKDPTNKIAKQDLNDATNDLAAAKANLIAPQMTLKVAKLVQDKHNTDLAGKKAELADAQAAPKYVNYINLYNQWKAAGANVNSSKDANNAIAKALNAYDAALAQQKDLDQKAADAKAAYEELLAEFNKENGTNVKPGDGTKTTDTTKPGDDTKTTDTTKTGDDTKTTDTTKDGNAAKAVEGATTGAPVAAVKDANGNVAQVKLATTKATATGCY